MCKSKIAVNENGNLLIILLTSCIQIVTSILLMLAVPLKRRFGVVFLFLAVSIVIEVILLILGAGS
jgi:hypothetical protein